MATAIPGAHDTISSYAELVSMFQEAGMLIQARSDEQQLGVGTRVGDLEGILVFTWLEEDRSILVTTGIELEIPRARITEVALALHVLNHTLQIPGFGLDVPNRLANFRLTLFRRPDGHIAKQRIKEAFNIAVGNAAKFFPAIQEVALRGADPLAISEAARSDDGAPT